MTCRHGTVSINLHYFRLARYTDLNMYKLEEINNFHHFVAMKTYFRFKFDQSQFRFVALNGHRHKGRQLRRDFGYQ